MPQRPNSHSLVTGRTQYFCLAHLPRTFFYTSAPDARKVDDSDIRLSVTFVLPRSGLVLVPLSLDWCHTRGRIERVYDRCACDHHVQVRSYPGAVDRPIPEPAS